jgi:hypothetical protein
MVSGEKPFKTHNIDYALPVLREFAFLKRKKSSKLGKAAESTYKQAGI